VQSLVKQGCEVIGYVDPRIATIEDPIERRFQDFQIRHETAGYRAQLLEMLCDSFDLAREYTGRERPRTVLIAQSNAIVGTVILAKESPTWIRRGVHHGLILAASLGGQAEIVDGTRPGFNVEYERQIDAELRRSIEDTHYIGALGIPIDWYVPLQDEYVDINATREGYRKSGNSAQRRAFLVAGAGHNISGLHQNMRRNLLRKVIGAICLTGEPQLPLPEGFEMRRGDDW